MMTHIYLVRHAESPFTVDEEETRGLSEKGWKDAWRVADILQAEQIEAFVSSSYARAIQTIEPAAARLGSRSLISPSGNKRQNRTSTS